MNKIIGAESCSAICTPCAALVAPGPRVTKQIPGRPVSRPSVKAIIAAPASWRQTVTSIGASFIASSAAKKDSPGTQYTRSTPCMTSWSMRICPPDRKAPATFLLPLRRFSHVWQFTLFFSIADTGTYRDHRRLAREPSSGHSSGMPAPAEHPAESSALTYLNARSREIFRNIVDSYLSTGEPVGSRHLSRMLPISLSPASVRNVMQDLEELGLIYAPHASAGRLPTQQGLRLFVDALLEFGDLGREERARIDSQVRAAAKDGGFEGALAETTGLLSELTRGAGVVLTSKTDAPLKHVEFVRLESGRALAILVAEDGSIENRVVATPPGMPASTFIEASNFLSARIRGRTLAEVTAEIEAARRDARKELDDIAARLVEAGLVSWS